MATRKNNPAAKPADRELVLTRILDAPCDLVFKAWTDPKRLAQWWGPKHFTNPVCELDLRPGGAIRIDMRAPDGTVYPCGGSFHEIAEPEKLVFTTLKLDHKGKTEIEVLNTVTFAEHKGRTKLTLRARVVKSLPQAAAALAGMEQGWNQSLDRLAKAMENDKHPTLGNGNVCYIEIPAIDINCSASFYKEVFGWRIRQRGDGHLAFDDTVGEVSGTWVIGRKAAPSPGLLVHIMVDSAAATIDAVIANGGKIVQPIGMDAPEVTARFSDPAGNIFGLYQHPTGKN